MKPLTALRQLAPRFGRTARIQRELGAQGRQLARILRLLEATHEATGSKGQTVKTLLRVESDVQSLVRHAYLDPDQLDPVKRLTSQRFGFLSQNAEDGITLALLREAGIANCRFVDIGCGGNGGNCGFLAQELEWSGVMVDASTEALREARLRFNPGRVSTVLARIDRENVDRVLSEAGATGEVDVFSLDIDGNDLWVWESVSAITPRIVIVEYNATFGPEQSVSIPYDPEFEIERGSTYFGASLTAFTRVAARKGYRLVCVEPRGANAFFVRNDLAPSLPAREPSEVFRPITTPMFVLGHEVSVRATDRLTAQVDAAAAHVGDRGSSLVQIA